MTTPDVTGTGAPESPLTDQQWAALGPEIDASVKRLAREQERHNGADVLKADDIAPGARYPHVWIDDAAIATDAAYSLKGIVESGRIIVFYGPTGGGKSTWTIDMGGHIAAEIPWRTRRVRRGLVVYVAAEAGASILLRVAAWRDHHLADSREARIPLAIITRATDLCNRVEVEKLIEALRAISTEAALPLALIVFDTLSRSAPGADENSPEDMGEIIGACDRLREATGAAVALIHHSGKDSGRGARGHSALTAAADTVVSIGDGIATVEKSRDGVAGERFPFQLVPVDLGTDADGDPITACIVRHLDTETPGQRPQRALTGVAKVALQALQEAISTDGETLPGTSTIPSGVRAVTIARWRAQFRTRYGTDPDGGDRDRDAIKKAFIRAREQLAQAEAVGVSDPYVWVSR